MFSHSHHHDTEHHEHHLTGLLLASIAAGLAFAALFWGVIAWLAARY